MILSTEMLALASITIQESFIKNLGANTGTLTFPDLQYPIPAVDEEWYVESLPIVMHHVDHPEDRLRFSRSPVVWPGGVVILPDLLLLLTKRKTRPYITITSLCLVVQYAVYRARVRLLDRRTGQLFRGDEEGGGGGE